MEERASPENTREFSEQKTSWLELFYDLAYVAAVAQLTYVLIGVEGTFADHVQFVFLYMVVFMSWFGNVVYRNIRGEEDDNYDRVITVVHMFFALVMSISLHDVLGIGVIGFVLGYVGTRITFLLLLGHAYRLWGASEPRREHVRWGYRISILIWLLSLLVPEPYRYVLWVAALALDIFAPFTKSFISREAPNVARVLNKHHLPERLGLFTILVMGESFIVVAVVNNIADGVMSLASGLIAAATFLIMVGIWWLYFTDVERYARGRRFQLFRYVYAHVPIVVGIMYIAAGTKIGMDDPLSNTDPFLLVAGGLGASMLGLNLLKLATGQRTLRLFWPTVGLLVVLMVFVPLNEFSFMTSIYLLTVVFAGYIYLENHECAECP